MNLDMKIFSDVRWIYKSIFQKILLCGLEMTYIGVFNFQEADFDRKINTVMILGVYRSILPKMSTLAIERKIAYLGVLMYEKVS